MRRVLTGAIDARTGRTVDGMPPPTGARFVLHDHRKPSPHFDLRLEEGGVLRSWAVPKGLPDDTGHDRLAIAVDDHELDHVDFEDEHKSIADDGTWEEHDRNERRLVFSLHGHAGVRRYALIHTGGTQWLLHLTREQPRG